MSVGSGFFFCRIRWTYRMVRLVYLDCPATFYLGPSLSERLYPRLTNGVTDEEVRDPPPSLEVCSYNCSAVIVLVLILFWEVDTTNILCAWYMYDRVT